MTKNNKPVSAEEEDREVMVVVVVVVVVVVRFPNATWDVWRKRRLACSCGCFVVGLSCGRRFDFSLSACTSCMLAVVPGKPRLLWVPAFPPSRTDFAFLVVDRVTIKPKACTVVGRGGTSLPFLPRA